MRENHLSHSRFGIVVGLKVSKKAVERNRLKRRMKDIMKQHLGDVMSGFDVMVLAQKSALEENFESLELDYLKALTKAGILKKE